MSSENVSQMVENTKDTEPSVVDRAPKDPSGKLIEKQPAGTVGRILNFRDRNLLVGACRDFCSKEGKGNHKAQSKLDRITKLVVFQETVDYFDMIDDSLEDALFRWQRLRNDWLALQQYMGGGLTAEDLKKKAPSVDLTDPPGKPSRRQPEATADESRGVAREFYFPSKLDVWAQEVLKAVTWSPLASEYVTELCEKFGIKDED